MSVQKGAHYTRKASECVVGVSDFFMTSLAKLTIKVGRGVKDMVQETEVRVARDGGGGGGVRVKEMVQETAEVRVARDGG